MNEKNPGYLNSLGTMFVRPCSHAKIADHDDAVASNCQALFGKHQEQTIMNRLFRDLNKEPKAITATKLINILINENINVLRMCPGMPQTYSSL